VQEKVARRIKVAAPLFGPEMVWATPTLLWEPNAIAGWHN